MLDSPVGLVTGSRRGIGRAIALRLARLGYAVVINDLIEDDAARAVQEEIVTAGGWAKICPADISSSADRSRLVDFIRRQCGRIDLLVNNAGIAPPVRKDILETDEASYDKVMAVNLKGPYFLTQLIAKWMIELRKQHSELRPRIVTVSSMSAYTASVNRGEYCISKAGLSMLTKLFAVRLAEFGIGVFEIQPGIIETDMTAAVKDKYDKLIGEGLTPIRRWGRPDDVADAVEAVARGLFDFATGQVLRVDGGFNIHRL